MVSSLLRYNFCTCIYLSRSRCSLKIIANDFIKMIYLHIFIVVLITNFGGVIGQDRPEISKVILPDVKRAGETGHLNCTVIRQFDNQVFWSFQRRFTTTSITISGNDAIMKDVNIIIDGFAKYDIVLTQEVGGATTYTLVVRRLQLDDSGTYTCYITLRGQTGTMQQPSKDGELIVLSPPVISPGSTTHTFTKEQGDSVTFACLAYGYPQPNVTWMRPNGRSIPAPYNKFAVQNETLVIPRVSLDDRGVYRCIANNNVRPPATFDVTLYVDFAPQAIAVQTSYGQSQTSRQYIVTLECRISGSPDPEIRWYKKLANNTRSPAILDDLKHFVNLLLNHGQTMAITEVWFQLVIINVEASDYGTYICEGRNRLGVNSSEVVLYETSECQGPFCYGASMDTSDGLMMKFSVFTFLLLPVVYFLNKTDLEGLFKVI